MEDNNEKPKNVMKKNRGNKTKIMLIWNKTDNNTGNSNADLFLQKGTFKTFSPLNMEICLHADQHAVADSTKICSKSATNMSPWPLSKTSQEAFIIIFLSKHTQHARFKVFSVVFMKIHVLWMLQCVTGWKVRDNTVHHCKRLESSYCILTV